MSKQVYKTPEEFKQAIKVGDYLKGWATDRVVQVTAIGEKDRFLAVSVFGDENVNTMTQNMGWEKVNEPDYWNAEEL